MGALDLIRNRDARAAQNVVGTDDYHFRDEKHHQASDFEVHAWGPSTETRSSAGLRQDAREGVTEDAQPGVQKAEAVALVWSKKAAFGTYALVWLGFFILALQSSISSAIIQNVFANFSAAPQVSTANILSNVVAGVLKLPVAKILTLWGRTEGLLVFVAIYVLGIIILAACNGPDSYAAGYVLYWVGYDALYLILDIFIADTTGLRNRAFAFAFASTPFICTAFTGPLAAQSFLKTSGWRWSYGVFAIVAPVVFLPLAVVFKVHEKKAENEGIFRRRPSGRTTIESIIHYIHEFDIIGAFLLMAAFTLVLLPFSLTSYGAAQYNSAAFIAMVVIGFLLFPTFAAWERFGARTHFIRWELLKDRTVLGACFLSALLFFSFYCWDLYLLNFCVVVFNLSIAMAGYVNQIFNVGSTFWSVLVGIVIRITRQFKYQTLFFGMPLLFLGSGLMIHFRGQNEDSTIGYVVMCQIFIAFGGSTLAIGQDMAVMAAADRESVPMMLSILSLSSSIGTAVGFAASASVFNNTFLKFLTRALPESSKDLAADIYIKGYVEQITYPVGSEIRNAINQAWSEYMKYACILSTCVLVLGFPAVAVWRNYRLDRKQNKGVVL